MIFPEPKINWPNWIARWWSDNVRWWNGNLGDGTPDTGSGPFRLNFIAAYRPIRFGCGWGCPLPRSAKRRDLL